MSEEKRDTEVEEQTPRHGREEGSEEDSKVDEQSEKFFRDEDSDDSEVDEQGVQGHMRNGI
jgi:hypothetical protein